MVKHMAGWISVLIICSGCAPDGYGPNKVTAGSCETASFAVASSGEDAVRLDEGYEDYIVKFSEDKSSPLSPSGKPLSEYEVTGFELRSIQGTTYSMKLRGDLETKRARLQELQESRAVEYVEPDYPIYGGQSVDLTDETILEQAAASQHWSHKAVKVADAWKITRGNSKLVVAVIDSGIDYTHPDLRGNMWVNPSEASNGRDDDRNGYVDDIHGWNFADNNNRPATNSRSNHGSHVAGIIGAYRNGSQKMTGIAPIVKLMALRFIGDNGAGQTSNAIRAIDYAVNKKVFLINNSWGSQNYSRALSDAIGRAQKAGVLFVVAAGNGNRGVGYDIDRTPWYPAAYPHSNILSVAASDTQERLTRFSNFGVRRVQVAAPGFQILSTVSGGGYQNMNGTSMAAPLVSGLAVLVKAANPSLGYSAIKNVLATSVDSISSMSGKVTSRGRINAYKAVVKARNYKNHGGGEVVPPPEDSIECN